MIDDGDSDADAGRAIAAAMVDEETRSHRPTTDADRAIAAAMLDEETRSYRPTKNYLDQLSVLKWSNFETELMKNEFERLTLEREVNFKKK